MVKVIFPYRKPEHSEVLAPCLKIKLGDPFFHKSVDILALLDTGYDGYMLIPQAVFESLDLFSYQYPDSSSVGEFITGEKIKLLSAEAAVKISGIDYDFIIAVDSLMECNETLIGLEFLSSLVTILDGPAGNLRIEYD